jgi:hypothetical protein
MGRRQKEKEAPNFGIGGSGLRSRQTPPLSERKRIAEREEEAEYGA